LSFAEHLQIFGRIYKPSGSRAFVRTESVIAWRGVGIHQIALTFSEVPVTAIIRAINDYLIYKLAFPDLFHPELSPSSAEIAFISHLANEHSREAREVTGRFASRTPASKSGVVTQ
jgi:hypothetical protein